MKKFIAGAIAAVGSIALFEALRRKGVVDQVTGKVKESLGQATEDKEMEAKGVFDQAKGKTKEFVSDVKEAMNKSVDDNQ
jgi:uncharacterized protein YjbJ (UPF0337 family)